jgi:hypothetical protein
VFEEEGTHGLKDLGEERRCCVGVHVDSAHVSILLCGAPGHPLRPINRT